MSGSENSNMRLRPPDGTDNPKLCNDPSHPDREAPADFVAVVHDFELPSCPVCGTEMVPTGYRCSSCGSESGAAPSPEPTKEPAPALSAAEFRKQWSHKPTPIPPNASGLWYSEECADQMLTEFAARVSAADKATIRELRAELESLRTK